LKEVIRVKGILKFLAAAKLVDLSEEERSTLDAAALEQHSVSSEDSVVEAATPEQPAPVFEFAQTVCRRESRLKIYLPARR
jgi:hypothetical protein